jgi:hypothetical protein
LLVSYFLLLPASQVILILEPALSMIHSETIIQSLMR